MGAQIIRQPDGLFAVFSGHSNTIVLADATEEDLLGYFGNLAIRAATRHVSRLLNQVKSGRPGEAFHQFALAWDEALAIDREHGGHVWQDYLTDDSGPGQRRAIQSADAGPAGVPRPGSHQGIPTTCQEC
jgi:hypothetical protein